MLPMGPWGSVGRSEGGGVRGTAWLFRFLRVAALVVGLAVLALSVVTGAVAARDQQDWARDHALTSEVGQQADAITEYFDRARSVALLLAQNAVFSDFYTAAGGTTAKIRAGGPLVDHANDALAYLEQLYPGRIGEACFIDRGGAEIARIVRGVRAPQAKLSADESSNPFFAPTLAMGLNEVYQARAYLSPDTKDWVISNSTMIPGQQAMVHFEVPLASFGSAVPLRDTTDLLSIVDARSGAVWVDSRDGTETGRPALADLVSSARASGITTSGGQRVAYLRLSGGLGNANTWYVAVSRAAPGTGWTHGFGSGSLALLLGALLTIAVALASLRSYHLAMRHAALHDPLTDLPNRALLADQLDAALARGQSASVLVVDLDRFKEVNNALGHRVGDQLLQQVAARLTANARGLDVVGRLGSDEFAIVMPDIADIHAARAAAEGLLTVLHHSFQVGDVTLDLEASIGVAVAPEHGRDAEGLLRHAEAAMHVAKDRRSGHAVFDPAAMEPAPGRLALLGDLRRALDTDDQIGLAYQPKIALDEGRLVGVEALCRWSHPTRGLVPPSEFISAAEATTLIQRLTFRVLTLALAQARRWRDDGIRVPIAVNLSTRCLLDSDLPTKLFDLLTRYELPASVLHLEITESTIMTDPDRALRVLHALHDGGIRLSIDDFGTGYSSMAYLKQLPVDELKVDQSFVRDMETVPSDAMLVQSVIELGHSLGLEVVAEGVENQAVLDALRGLGCDIAQGYHLGRPMAAEAFVTWLASRPRVANASR